MVLPWASTVYNVTDTSRQCHARPSLLGTADTVSVVTNTPTLALDYYYVPVCLPQGRPLIPGGPSNQERAVNQGASKVSNLKP